MAEEIMLRILIALAIIAGYCESRPQNEERSIINLGTKCGYASCPKTDPKLLNVHLIPHTHDDVGWLKTVDQYYYGSRNNIQKAGVQYILDSVVTELLKDPKRRFIYVESAFFFKWWKEQTPELQQKVKMLVNEGRLEFIGGAWSMNDEATTHYQSVIDQFTWGLKRLNDTFGECGRPRIGWQIDPFGHSREMASMFAQMGFDGLFFGRLDYQDKDERLMTKKAEMIWRASANLGESAHLFTGALFNQYQPPPGFCFDILCNDEPIIDSKRNGNVNRRVDDFFDFIEKQRRYYRTNNIIITMGGDFTYQDANISFKNMDKLIRYANQRQVNGSDINLIYSTPSCYLKSLHDAGITWPTKDDDFFPYASDPHAYWTGYFSSRPTLKRYERDGNHFLQVCKQLTALAPQKAPYYLPHLNFLRESMGVMQHHDAITGTEKQHVAADYARRLEVALRACGSNTRDILNHLTTGEEPQPSQLENHNKDYRFDFQSCGLLNISICNISEENERFIVTLYNTLSHATQEYVRIPVPDINYIIEDYRAVTIDHQIVPIPEAVQNLTFRTSRAEYELVFFASELPPMGYKSYYITKTNKNRLPPQPDPEKMSSLTQIGNEFISLLFDSNNFLSAITVDGMTRIINQEFLYYEAAIGNNREFRNRSSGAYIFRPKEDQKVRTVSVQPKMTVYRGSLVEEVHQQFNDWISQVVRVYKNQRYAEFEWMVGPIPVEDGIGKEIITRFNSDIASEGIFYTDSNGREMIKRLRDHRDTWKVRLLEHTAGNYYPITTKIALEDENARMAILTDRAQGGSSMGDGSLELMVHRRLLHDDAFGVDEALNETAYGEGLVARGKHYLFLGSSQIDKSPTLQAHERFTQLEKLLPTWKFFSNAENYPYDDWRQTYTNIFSGITLSLPQNIHLMSFEPWHENEILLRFEHLLEKDEDPELSKSVQFNLKDVMRGFKIAGLRETTLDGNSWVEENRRMQFVPDPEDSDYENYAMYAKSATFVKLLRADKPMVATEYSDEELLTYGLGAESNRLKRDVPNANLQLNRLRSEKLAKIKRTFVADLPLQNDDDKFIIEISAMQIRTFILSLEKNI